MQINMKTQLEIDAEKKKADTEKRRAEILAELDAIDKKKVRPLTAFLLKEETEEDKKVLKELEDRAKALRKTLNDLK